MQSKKYFEMEGLSSSSLKDFSWMSPSQFKEIYIDKNITSQNKTHFNNGSLLDSLLLDPDSIEESFYFCPSTMTNASEVMKNILESVWSKTKEQLLDVADTMDLEDVYLDKNILAAAKELNYSNGKYSNERILKDIRKQDDYFKFLKAANNRTIISFSDNLLAIEKKNILLKTYYTKDFFIEHKDEILFHHVQIQINEDIKLKGELDILRIVPKEKTIYIADLKTTHTISSFMENVRKYSYATQLSFYRHLFTTVMNNVKISSINHKHLFEKYKDYKIICCNIVIDDKSKIPQIFRYTNDSLKYYEYGSSHHTLQTRHENLRYKKGWREVLENIKEHYKLNRWDLPLGHINKGYMEMDLIENYVW